MIDVKNDFLHINPEFLLSNGFKSDQWKEGSYFSTMGLMQAIFINGLTIVYYGLHERGQSPKVTLILFADVIVYKAK